MTSEQTKVPSCTEKGERAYTAVFTVDWAAAQTKTVADIDALGHDYKDGKCTVYGVSDLTNPDVPKTGDDGNLVLWVAVMLVAAGGLAGTVACGRKKYGR